MKNSGASNTQPRKCTKLVRLSHLQPLLLASLPMSRSILLISPPEHTTCQQVCPRGVTARRCPPTPHPPPPTPPTPNPLRVTR